MLKVRDLEMLNDIGLVYKNKIVLYGAGDYGHRALRLLAQLEIPVYGVFDSNERICEKRIRGHRVRPAESLAEIYGNEQITIIITIANPAYVENVLERLEQDGLVGVTCYTFFALKFTVELHINDKRIKETYREDFFIARNTFFEYMQNYWENRGRRLIYSTMLQDMVIVLQPGKVGSSSIVASLEKLKIYCIHSHCLSFTNWLSNDIHNAYGSRYCWQYKLSEELKSFHSMQKIKVISLVRDPIGRAVSDFFQGLEMSEYSRYDSSDLDICQRINNFIRRESEVGCCGYMFEWFNQEIKEVFGIDVYEHDFDRKKGWQLIYKDNVELLLLKSEKLDDCQEIIGEFVENDNFELIKENVGNEKPCKFAYDEVKRIIEIPEVVLNFYYKDNQAMDHFYTEEEKKGFYKKWLR